MRQRIAFTILSIFFSTQCYALPPTLHLSTDKQRLAHEAARILQQEAEQARASQYPLVVMVPTGSTAIPFYEQIVRLHQEQQLDLSHVTLFNMDEYVGTPNADEQLSYNAFMKQHLYQHVVDKPRGLVKSKVHIPSFSRSVKEAELAAQSYRNTLDKAIHEPGARFIVFGGIGASPAHIAFNDLTTEKFYSNKRLSDAKKTEKALSLPTRLVSLDTQTSQTNQVDFTHAITVGMAELMQADRIIIMANTPSKRASVENTFLSEPTYKVPASLLSKSKGTVEFWITPELNTLALASKALGIEPATTRASLLDMRTASTQTVVPDPQKRVLMVRFDENQEWPTYWNTHYPHSLKITTTDAQEIQAVYQQTQPALVVLPLAHNENTRTAISKIESIAAEQALKWGKTLIAQYDTEPGLLSRYNYWIALDDEQQTRFENARNQHVSQVRRTAFADIPKIKSQSLLKLSQPHHKQISAKGLEGYFVSDIHGNALNQFDPALFTDKDKLVVIAPHPDDAEIGAAGLIDRFAHTPTEVWTVTQGHHIAISVDDVIDNPNMSEALVTQAIALKRGLIEDPNLKSAIRHEETSNAVSLLAQRHQHPHQVKPLALPFYDNHYQVSSDDRSKLMQEIDTLADVNNIVIAVPFEDDEHIAHRIAREIALEQFQSWGESHPEHTLTIVAYSTPWTGRYRLYDYNNAGDTADAIIGAERLQGKGLAGNALWEELNRASAQRYQLYQVG